MVSAGGGGSKLTSSVGGGGGKLSSVGEGAVLESFAVVDGLRRRLFDVVTTRRTTIIATITAMPIRIIGLEKLRAEVFGGGVGDKVGLAVKVTVGVGVGVGVGAAVAVGAGVGVGVATGAAAKNVAMHPDQAAADVNGVPMLAAPVALTIFCSNTKLPTTVFCCEPTSVKLLFVGLPWVLVLLVAIAPIHVSLV